MPDQHVATVEFADGTRRQVFEQPGGRQYVDDNGVPLFGVWYIPRDEPQPDAVVGDVVRSVPNGPHKPTLTLMLPETAEDFAELFEQLTGRKPTAEEMDELREECKDLPQSGAGGGDVTR
jgi:hypothetical protein